MSGRLRTISEKSKLGTRFVKIYPSIKPTFKVLFVNNKNIFVDSYCIDYTDHKKNVKHKRSKEIKYNSRSSHIIHVTILRAVHHNLIIKVTKALNETQDLRSTEVLVNIRYSSSPKVKIIWF